ncbi:hypothetical protein HDU97_004872 [Phlyctochytrium planicorne]|nr:hypothetical protein HDU97_004872 [Phlyctochytrium planicorne]
MDKSELPPLIATESREDIAFLRDELRRFATQSIENQCKDESQSKAVRQGIDEFINKTFKLAAGNISVNGMPFEDVFDDVDGYEQFDEKLLRDTEQVISQVASCRSRIAALRKTLPDLLLEDSKNFLAGALDVNFEEEQDLVGDEVIQSLAAVSPKPTKYLTMKTQLVLGRLRKKWRFRGYSGQNRQRNSLLNGVEGHLKGKGASNDGGDEGRAAPEESYEQTQIQPPEPEPVIDEFLKPFPYIISTDLNVRPLNKAKRHELQPTADGIIINISCCIPTPKPIFGDSSLFWDESCVRPTAPDSFGVLNDLDPDMLAVADGIMELHRKQPLDHVGVAEMLTRFKGVPLELLIYMQRLLELKGLLNVNIPAVDNYELIESRIYEDTYQTTLGPEACFNCKVQTRAMFRCIRVRCLQLCPNCFMDGCFPAFLSSKDFVRTFSARGPALGDEDFWSEKDCAVLLRAIDTHKDDWSAIAKAVGSFSKEQCMKKFLQMDLTKDLFSTEATERAEGTSNSSFGKLSDTAFYHSANPVMALLMLLHQSLSPSLASNCAKELLKYSTAFTENPPHFSILLEKILADAVKSSEVIAAQLETFSKVRLRNLTDMQLKKVKLEIDQLEHISKIKL